MPKVTVRVDENTYREIRTWCAQRDTCVSHVVQAFLRNLPSSESGFRLSLPPSPAPQPTPSQAERIRDAEIDMINLRIGQRR